MTGVLSYVVSRLQMLSTSDHASMVSMNLFVALLCACIVIGHLLEENRLMNESITVLIIGVCTRVVIMLISKGKSSHILVFSEDLFFIYLLPPIIFNAGFQVKKKQFFVNFITIMLFGVVGKLISCTIIALGQTLTRFSITLRQIGLYKKAFQSQVEHVLNDWLLQFVNVYLHDVKGILEEQEKLVGVLRQVDVVICTFAILWVH